MTKEELEKKAEQLFPLPDKNDYVYGEAYLIESALVLEQRKIWVAGGMYVIENTK